MDEKGTFQNRRKAIILKTVLTTTILLSALVCQKPASADPTKHCDTEHNVAPYSTGCVAQGTDSYKYTANGYGMYICIDGNQVCNENIYVWTGEIETWVGSANCTLVIDPVTLDSNHQTSVVNNPSCAAFV